MGPRIQLLASKRIWEAIISMSNRGGGNRRAPEGRSGYDRKLCSLLSYFHHVAEKMGATRVESREFSRNEPRRPLR